MHIKSEDKTIKTILNCGSTFMIPRFQREYSWDKENYREFLNDMIKSLKICDGTIKADEYFMGTMLFVGELGKDNQVYVVDGQQRLTTITILFSALSDHFRKMGEELLSESVFRYIMSKDDDGEEKRILISKTNYPYFAYFIQDRNKREQREAISEEEQSIFETYQYLYNQTSEKNIRRLLANTFKCKVDGLGYMNILKALRDQVLQTVVITISNQDKKQANMIFEILNAKGKRLAEVDLIKNKIFEVLSETEPVDFADQMWSDIKNKLDESKMPVGFASFYSHFWASSYKKSSKKNLYDDFNKKITSNADCYKAFLNNMMKNVGWYVQIIEPTREYWENKKQYYSVVQSLNAISNYFAITQSRVALMALFDAKDRDLIKAHEFSNAIIAIEKFHYSFNSICSKRANKLDNVYSDFAIRIRKCTNRVEAISQLEDLYEKLEKLYPTYEEFEKCFIKLSYSSKDSNPDNLKSKYSINIYHCLSEKNKYSLFPDDGSIEHILPESRGANSLNIGNLIVLETDINGECGSLNYSDKIDWYSKSKYKCVKDFIDVHTDWTENEIEDRAKAIAHDIYYKWIMEESK